jgi:hypothetical protein
MPLGHGKGDRDPDTPGRAVERLRLLDALIRARKSGDRREADRSLVEANRWLKRYPFDVRVMEARDRLRETYPVDYQDIEEGDAS